MISNVTNIFLIFSAAASLGAKPSDSAVSISPADVSKHASKADCWIIIDGNVYDVSSYIKDHPAPEETIVNSCGKDATIGWKTKGKAGRPHSKKAAFLLKTFLKGKLAS